MNLAVVGLGAMGKLFGGRFAASGTPTFLLDYREDRARQIHTQGLTITGPEGAQHANLYADHRIEHIPVPTHVLVCVKAHQTLTALERLRPWFTKDTTVMLLQNGMPDLATLASLVSPAILALAVTTEGATSVDDTTVKHTGHGKTYLGPLNPASRPSLTAFKEAAVKAGFETIMVPDIGQYAWSKLLVNAGVNALGAILRVPNGVLLHPAHWGQVELAVKEGLQVMTAKGLVPAWDPFAFTRKVCEMTKDNLNSMFQDLQTGRPTEVDALNGYMAREGAALSIPTPVNASFVTMIHALEHQEGELAPLKKPGSA